MSSDEIRKKFIDFFVARGHVLVPSSSLLPSDPSVLLTTAGVQQFKPYYTGQLDPMKDFGSLNVISIQKSFRTSDIEEVGDATHGTFFEMLGYFSFGGYFKKETIAWCYEFLTKILKISPERLIFSIFEGSDLVPQDNESLVVMKDLNFSKSKIKLGGVADNFWGPTGNQGPCGPSVEVYVDEIEVGTLVFNEYFCSEGREHLLAGRAKLEKLSQPGVDVGLGLERLVALVNGIQDIYMIDLLNPLIMEIKKIVVDIKERVARILTDHIKASVFLIADGVRPSNKESGYILRRLLRRMMAYQIDFDAVATAAVAWVKETYGAIYPEVGEDGRILEVLQAENTKFAKVLRDGLRELKKYDHVGAKEAFYLYESFGLPFEVVIEMAPVAAKGLRREDFEAELTRHREISRAGVEKKFGGHGLLLDTGELKAGNEEELQKVLRLHTATHLLQQALREVLGDEVKQAGSDITAERTRFDFTFGRKLTAEEIKKVEERVNETIQKDLPVAFVQMPKLEAEKTGALFFFKQKYPETVKVYYVGHSLKDAYSKEFCGGPHVDHTLEIGKFKILKEEAVGAGVRRIRATV